MKLIECVPNFSEGRDPEVIEAITREISETPGAGLLDVDPGRATHRTVVTILGSPEAVEEAAFRAIAKAAELIDMSKHSGEHARMGATDVCPFVPVRGATMEDCIEVAGRLGKRVGEELGLSVYLYDQAAARPERRSLADVRAGEYEALAEKMTRPENAPDFGPAEFNARSGATAIGAREFLIAYNVNLNTRDARLAKKIALELREKGKLKRDENRKIVRDKDGQRIWVPGRFRELRGVGWYIDEFARAQVSFNLTNSKITAVHEVFDACCEEAAKLGVRVTGSELVGLIPLEAMLSAGDHYLTQQGASRGVSEAERIHVARLSMGLDDLGPFEANEKIIEYKYRGAPSGLKAMTILEFTEELASDSPAPGGGSVAALCGALAASLTSMVAALTWPKKGFEGRRQEMQILGVEAHALKAWFVDAIDADTEAFNEVLAAMRLPKKTDEDKKTRAIAMEKANQGATRVPLSVLEKAVTCFPLALAAVEHGNPNSISDAAVAGACALAAAEGAALNVRINTPTLTDDAAKKDFLERATALIEEARGHAQAIQNAVDKTLGSGLKN